VPPQDNLKTLLLVSLVAQDQLGCKRYFGIRYFGISTGGCRESTPVGKP
jgi:hypothetical protein